MEKAIIINDSRLEKAVLKDQLIRLGYKVEVADEYDWQEKVHSFMPDVAIVNYTMQHITGDQIIATIKTRYPNISAFLSSCNKLRASQFAEAEFSGVITTPISLGDLENVLLNKASFCSLCSQALNGDFAFCPYCGGKL